MLDLSLLFTPHPRCVAVALMEACCAVRHYVASRNKACMTFCWIIVVLSRVTLSQWGSDFRPDYKRLGLLKATFPHVPALAVTATATVQVRRHHILEL